MKVLLLFMYIIQELFVNRDQNGISTAFLINLIEYFTDLRRGIVPYFFVTVTVIVTVIMILAMFIFYFCLKQQDKHCIRHYDCDYDKKIRYKYGPKETKERRTDFRF